MLWFSSRKAGLALAFAIALSLGSAPRADALLLCARSGGNGQIKPGAPIRLRPECKARETALPLSIEADGTLVVTGANLKLLAGTGTTDAAPNGKGNLIIGYDEGRCFDPSEPGKVGAPCLSDEQCGSGTTCDLGVKGGSHNLVVGPGHHYTSTGGFVAGSLNAVKAPSASVSGGSTNVANGAGASVSGGIENVASGAGASVGGGSGNLAAEPFSTVVGGSENSAHGQAAVVVGGFENAARGANSVTTGGEGNVANGYAALAGGGMENEASGEHATAHGGVGNEASGHFSSVSGGGGNVASGDSATVGGGVSRTAASNGSWAAGGLFEPN